VILRGRIVNLALSGSLQKFMTVAASFEQTRHHSLGVRGVGSHWRRLAILLGLVTADLACFAVADGILHLLATPPALALFRNRSLGQPNSVIDLVMIILSVTTAAGSCSGMAHVPPPPRCWSAAPATARRYRCWSRAAWWLASPFGWA
jgi:hypothetical protein